MLFQYFSYYMFLALFPFLLLLLLCRGLGRMERPLAGITKRCLASIESLLRYVGRTSEDKEIELKAKVSTLLCKCGRVLIFRCNSSYPCQWVSDAMASPSFVTLFIGDSDLNVMEKVWLFSDFNVNCGFWCQWIWCQWILMSMDFDVNGFWC